MNANELYVLIPEDITNCLGSLKGFYYDHLPEVENSLWGLEDKNTRAEVKIVKDFDFDGRRFWALKTIWFDSKPFMITQNAGREGDDHYKRFITDVETFKEFVQYVKQLSDTQEYYLDDVISPEKDFPELTAFYGNKLNGEFKKYY